MKSYFDKVIADKTAKMAEIQNKIDSAKTADEVRAYDKQLDELADEIATAKAAQIGNASSFKPNEAYSAKKSEIYGSMEYRQAFADYVKTGRWSFSNEDELITTEDVGKAIPTTIMKEFIKKLTAYGQLYSLVRKINIKGGVEFPISELVPTVTWISETAPSDTQKVPTVKTSVSFGYHVCEARIAQSLLSQVVTLDILEDEIARLLAEAFMREFDRVIINGTGTGQPLGIANDTRVPTDNIVSFSATDMADWTKFRKNLFAKIPLAYRGEGVLVMTAATWESNIMTLKDANNRPLYQETYNPQNGKIECRFAGRNVVLVESDILADYDTATAGDVWGVYLKPTDYCINTNMQLTMKRYFNEDTNRWINKGICILDGKLLDTNGVFVLKKG